MTLALLTTLHGLEAPVLMGAETGYPPFSFLNEENEITGFSVELAGSILNKMNVSYRIHVDKWAVLKDLLQEGAVDLLPLVARAPEREGYFDFTFPYMELHGTLFFHENSPLLSSLEDLKGSKIAVMQSDTADEYISARVDERDIVRTETFNEAMLLLSEKKVDAVAAQRLMGLETIKELGIENIRPALADLPGFNQSFSLAVKEGDSELLATLNEGLSLVIADGTFDRLQFEWFSPLGAYRSTQKKIRIGGDSDYPPYEFLDENGEPAGFNVDLTKAIAQYMDLDVEIILAPWTVTYNRLINGEIDMVQGLFYSPERDLTMAFTQAHSSVNHVAITRVEDSPINSFEDLEGKRILVLKNDITHEMLKGKGLEKQLIPVDSFSSVLIKLASGEGDCAIAAQSPADYWIRKLKITNLTMGQYSFISAQYNYGALEEKSEYLNPFKEGLSLLKANGEYRKIDLKWLGIEDEERSFKFLNLFILSIFILAIMILLLFYNRRLKKLKMKKDVSEDIQLCTVLQQIDSFLWILNIKGTIIKTNESFRLMFEEGFDKDEEKSIKDGPWSDYFSFIPLNHYGLINLKQMENSFEHRYLDGKGTLHRAHTEISIYKDRNSGSNLLVGLSTDASKSKSKGSLISGEEVIQDREFQGGFELEGNDRHMVNLEKAIDQSPLSIVITDFDGNILFINKKTCEISGYGPEELLGENARIFRSGLMDSTVYKDLWDTIKEGRDWNGKLQNRKKSGELYWEQVIISPVKGPDDKIETFIASKEDISELVERESENVLLEKRLRQKSQLDIIGEIAGGIAHDYNNMLNGILNSVYLLKNIRDKDEEKAEAYLNIITQAAERAIGLSEQLKSFGHKEDLLFEKLNLHFIIAETADVLKESLKENISLSMDLSARNFLISGNSSEIHNCIMNICENAVQSMESGGDLIIRTRDTRIERSGEINSFKVEKGTYCTLEIEDKGCGIPAENIERIFEPFFTTREPGKGSGLGLAAVYGTMLHHNGYVEVRSEENKGTIFGLSFKITGDIEMEDNKDGNETGDYEMKGASKRILVVDDEQMNRIVLPDLLESMGYDSLVAADGYEALEIYQREKDSIDLIILDFMMPELNGKETFLKLLEIDSDVQVIVASGFSENEDIEQMKEKGLAGVLRKPYRTTDLERVLKELEN